MSRITLDPQLKTRLNGLNEHLEICDESGNILGHFLPQEVYKKLLYSAIEAACPHDKAEQERRRREIGAISLAEFWKKLEA